MKKRILKVLIIAIIINVILVAETFANNETVNEEANTNSTATNNTVDQNNTTTSENTTEKNEVENSNITSPSTSNNNNNNNTASNKTTSQTYSKKSDNANLVNLGIKPHDFSGFTPSKTNYEVEVPEDVDEVEVYAQAQDSKAKISGTGKVTLSSGENIVNVQVTAEDGKTVKTYTINIIRKESETEVAPVEELENEQNTGKGLLELKIEGVKNFEPKFNTNIYEYNVKYIGEATALNIETKPTEEDFVIEVIGNQELKDGENTITILVSDADGNNVATYQLMVNKSLVDEEAIAREKQQKQRIMIVSAIVAVIIIIAIIIIIKKKKNKSYAEEYTIPYSEQDDEEDYYEENNNYNFNDEYNYNNYNNVQNDMKNNEKEELKEKIRQEFLDNYNFDENGEEIPRKRHKAKRYR